LELERVVEQSTSDFIREVKRGFMEFSREGEDKGVNP
jgi:hypothetical protein